MFGSARRLPRSRRCNVDFGDYPDVMSLSSFRLNSVFRTKFGRHTRTRPIIEYECGEQRSTTLKSGRLPGHTGLVLSPLRNRIYCMNRRRSSRTACAGSVHEYGIGGNATVRLSHVRNDFSMLSGYLPSPRSLPRARQAASLVYGADQTEP